VNNICMNSKYKDGMYCRSRFSVYKELCTDMPGMANCTSYKSMCMTNQSFVQECNAPALPLPSSADTLTEINSICSTMSMAACSKCSSTQFAMGLPCEVLQVYSDLCVNMPNMQECAKWQAICNLVPDWPICKAGTTLGPIMRMYFHTDYWDYVLFEQWVPSTSGYYAGTWFLVMLFAVLFEFFKLYRTNMERKWAIKIDPEESQSLTLNGGSFSFPHFRPQVDFARAILHFVEVAWGLLIMLVVMTFNLGLFFAVCVGGFFGMLFVGRFLKYEPAASSCH